MSIHAVDWVDALTSQPMGGNGCAVVRDAAALDAATCIRFVRETSLVECTFLEPSDVADVKVRYFLASHEIPFAGHPTVATAASLYHRGILTGPMMTFETGAGNIPVEVTEGEGGPVFTMTQAKPEFGPTAPPEEVATQPTTSATLQRTPSKACRRRSSQCVRKRPLGSQRPRNVKSG